MSVRRPRARLLLLAALALLFCASCRKGPPFGSDFEGEEDLDRIRWECRTLLRLSPDHATSGSRSLEIRFFPAPEGEPDNYPGISFEGFDPRWGGRSAFCLDAFNPGEEPLPLVLRIDDRVEPPYGDRFHREIPLAPGANRVRIPLAELVTSGTGRRLEPDRVRAVVLFLDGPRERRTLYLDRLRLE